jgi:hypothetical protein
MLKIQILGTYGSGKTLFLKLISDILSTLGIHHEVVDDGHDGPPAARRTSALAEIANRSHEEPICIETVAVNYTNPLSDPTKISAGNPIHSGVVPHLPENEPKTHALQSAAAVNYMNQLHSELEKNPNARRTGVDSWEIDMTSLQVRAALAMAMSAPAAAELDAEFWDMKYAVGYNTSRGVAYLGKVPGCEAGHPPCFSRQLSEAELFDYKEAVSMAHQNTEYTGYPSEVIRVHVRKQDGFRLATSAPKIN